MGFHATECRKPGDTEEAEEYSLLINEGLLGWLPFYLNPEEEGTLGTTVKRFLCQGRARGIVANGWKSFLEGCNEEVIELSYVWGIVDVVRRQKLSLMLFPVETRLSARLWEMP